MNTEFLQKNKQEKKNTGHGAFSVWLDKKRSLFRLVEKNEQKIALGIQTPLKEIFNASKKRQSIRKKESYKITGKNIKTIEFDELSKAKIKEFVVLFNKAKTDFSVADFVGYFNNGIYLKILNKKKVQSSLNLVKISTLIERFTNDIIFIEVDKNTKCLIDFDFVEKNNRSLHRTVLIYVKEYSNVKILNKNVQCNTYCNCVIVVEKNSKVVLADVIFGEKEYLSHTNVVVKENAQIDIRNLCVGRKQAKIDLSVLSKNTGDLSNTKIRSYGIIADLSCLVYKTLIDIGPDLKQITGSQKAKFITFSDKVKVDAIPAINIASEDIKCSHAVSIDSIHDMETYYPMLRGLTKKQARTLFLQSLFKNIFCGFPQECVGSINGRITKYLNNI